MNNLRPIALLPLPGKIAERLFHTQLSEYLEHYNLLNPNQYSFRKNKSTLDLIASFTDDVLLDINEGHPTVAVFVDMKKSL